MLWLQRWAMFFAVLAMLPWTVALRAEKVKEPPRIVFINVDVHHWHWSMIADATKKAAQDLGVKLEVIDTVRDHLLYRKTALGVLARPDAPDFLLIGNEKESAAKVLTSSRGVRTKIFLFNNGFVSAENRTRLRAPRVDYPQWIGQLIPDNYQSGYDTGVVLFEALQKAFPNEELQVLGLTGAFNTHASLERERGFMAAADRYPRVRVMQNVSAEWNGSIAENKTYYLLRRYPRIRGIWSANDEMAEGAMRAAEKNGKVPGKDILFTGFGWSATGMAAIQDSRMLASAGGHFLDGAWAMARLYDYHNGLDNMLDQQKSQLILMDASNVARIKTNMDQKKWQRFDFKKWSRLHNPKLKSYDANQRDLLLLP